MSEPIATGQSDYYATIAGSRLPEAVRIAREIVNNEMVSPDVRAIAASVIRRHGLPVKLDS
jgi:hypothetical protein